MGTPAFSFADASAPMVSPFVPREGVACAVVRCGTSRVVVLRDDSVSGQAPDMTGLLDLILGDGAGSGLGGSHYQDNKVALVLPGRNASEYGFRFYQIDGVGRRVLADMECGNAATGAGLFALLQKLAAPGPQGRLEAVNLGTGQAMELHLPNDAPVHRGDWLTRFRYEPPSPSSPDPFAGVERTLRYGSHRPVRCYVLDRGNVFVLGETARPGRAPEPALVAALQLEGTRHAMSMGTPRTPVAPKVLLFRVTAQGPTGSSLEARCFFQDSEHRSIPGSGAMCLAGFVASRQLASMRPPGPSGALDFRITHASGSLAVRARWERRRGYRIVSTEFSTPVRLLLYGTALMPS